MPPLPPVASFGSNSPAFSVSNEEHLAKILLGTLAIDSELRERAESDTLFLTAEHSPAFVRSLVTLTVTGYPPAPAVRAQAALVLRLHLPSFWCEVDPETREWLKMRLLAILSENSSREVRYPLLLAVVSVAFCVSMDGDGSTFPYDLDHMGGERKEKYMFEDAWPAFTANLIGNLLSDHPHERHNALEVVTMLADSDNNVEVYSIFKKYAPAIMTGLERGLGDFLPEIRIAAVFCTVYIIDVIAISDELPVQSLSSRLLNVLMAFVDQGQFDHARTIVEMFVDQHTSYWGHDLNALGLVLLQLARLPEVKEDEHSRRLYLSAVEAMLTIFEDHSRCAVEDCIFLCTPLFSICTEGLLDSDNTDAFVEAQSSLHRLATALGGVDITNTARDCLGEFLFSVSSWQHRHAGVCAIAEIHEASVGAFEDDFEIIVNCVKAMQFNDPHPRVRSAAALTLHKLTGVASG